MVLASVAITVGTALMISPQMTIGGVNEAAATMIFATFFLFALVKGFLSLRRGQGCLAPGMLGFTIHHRRGELDQLHQTPDCGWQESN